MDSRSVLMTKTIMHIVEILLILKTHVVQKWGMDRQDE